MHPIFMYRESALFCLIVAQLSVISSTFNIEQIQTSSDSSSPIQLFPEPDDSGFAGILGLSTPEGHMVDGGQWRQIQDPFSNGGNFELASWDKNCTPLPKRRRARRDDQKFCPNTPQIITSPENPQKAGQQSGGSQRQITPPQMQQNSPKIPEPEDPNQDTSPILLEQLDVPQPDPSICPWGIAKIPICAKPEDSDDSKDILPGMGFISDFIDIVHWNRYDPAKGCQEQGEILYCCHFVKPQPILTHHREEDVPEVDLSSPLRPFDGWFNHNPDEPEQPSPNRERVRDYTATLCRPGPSADYPGPQKNNH